MKVYRLRNKETGLYFRGNQKYGYNTESKDGKLYLEKPGAWLDKHPDKEKYELETWNMEKV
jgi:hypothetical protein